MIVFCRIRYQMDDNSNFLGKEPEEFLTCLGYIFLTIYNNEITEIVVL